MTDLMIDILLWFGIVFLGFLILVISIAAIVWLYRYIRYGVDTLPINISIRKPIDKKDDRE